MVNNGYNVVNPCKPNVINNYHLGMVYTTHKNGDDLGIVYGIGFATLEGFFSILCQYALARSYHILLFFFKGLLYLKWGWKQHTFVF